MIWQQRTTSDYYCTTYPFFNLHIRYYSAYGRVSPHYTYNTTSYKTLDLAKSAAILTVKKQCKLFLNNPEKFDFDNNYIIRAKYDTWAGNTGQGKYVKSDYQWLEGSYIPNYGSYICYNIRFDKNISYKEIHDYRIKIIKRHCIRFLKEN